MDWLLFGHAQFVGLCSVANWSRSTTLNRGNHKVCSYVSRHVLPDSHYVPTEFGKDEICVRIAPAVDVELP